MSAEVPFKRLIEFLPDGLVLLDPSGVIIYMNSSAEKLIGSSFAEAIGKHWKDVFSVRMEDPVSEQTGSLMEILLERPVLITKSGQTVPIELQISQIPDNQGGRSGSMLLLHDVTELNVEKEGLKESRAKYKRLLNSIEGVVWEAEGETMHIRFVSDFAERMLGYSPKNWVKTPDFWKTIIHPEDRQSVLDTIAQAVQQREDYQIEYRVIAADGRILQIRDSVTLSVDEDRCVRLTGVMTDTTLSKQARDALIKSEERFSVAFHSNPVPILLMTVSGTILDANESFERMTGFFLEELIDRKAIDCELCTAPEFESVLQAVEERAPAYDALFSIRTKTSVVRSLPASFQKVVLTGEPCLIAYFRPD